MCFSSSKLILQFNDSVGFSLYNIETTTTHDIVPVSIREIIAYALR